jgi:HPt (histidine-containing phosphotransfer) domain-containing protein
LEPWGTDRDHVDSERNLTPKGTAPFPNSGEPGLQESDRRSLDAAEQAGGPVGDGVGSLEGDLGAKVYDQLVAAFLGDLSLAVALLGVAAAAGDIPAARYVAHQIKGTAPSFGAAHLDELAERLLQIGRDERQLLSPVVDEIDEEVGRLKAVLGASGATDGSAPAGLPAAVLLQREVCSTASPIR